MEQLAWSADKLRSSALPNFEAIRARCHSFLNNIFESSVGALVLAFSRNCCALAVADLGSLCTLHASVQRTSQILSSNVCHGVMCELMMS